MDEWEFFSYYSFLFDRKTKVERKEALSWFGTRRILSKIRFGSKFGF
jgi:hypothetical protein